MGIEIAIVVLALLVGIPLLTFVHELGHAVAAIAAIGGRVTVVQGPEPFRYRPSVGRFDLRLHGMTAPHRAWVGWARWERDASPRRHAVALAGGPLASLLAAIGCAVGSLTTYGPAHWIFFALAVDAAAQLTSSALPVRYPSFSGEYAGVASDGLKIRHLLSGAALPPPDPAQPAPTARDHAAAT